VSEKLRKEAEHDGRWRVKYQQEVVKAGRREVTSKGRGGRGEGEGEGRGRGRERGEGERGGREESLKIYSSYNFKNKLRKKSHTVISTQRQTPILLKGMARIKSTGLYKRRG
jgi:hypothetical protein